MLGDTEVKRSDRHKNVQGHTCQKDGKGAGPARSSTVDPWRPI